MSMSEFDLIKRFFTRATPGALLGVGDDAALVRASDGNVLAVSCDMLVSGTHFFADADPYLLGHKTLAVNLSDMAAMGAAPRWATLAIALPSADELWLDKFSAGFFALAQHHGVELIGGDTTRGPLNLCVTIIGEVPAPQALRRSGAQIGDEIWVSGSLGDAAMALAHLRGGIVLDEAEFAACASRLHQPLPRVALGIALRGIASSAIDISDGLLADLGHILDASQVGARLDFTALPVSPTMRKQVIGARASCPQISGQDARAPANNLLGKQCVLSGGDDYELCFTAPHLRHTELLSIAAKLGLPLTPIGEIVAGRECIVHDASGKPIKLEISGYDHFR